MHDLVKELSSWQTIVIIITIPPYVCLCCSRCIKYRVCVCALLSPNGTGCRHLAIAQRLYCHLTRRLRHTHRPNEPWKRNIDERKPKTKMKKLFPLFAICCFRFVDNCFMCLCACVSFACGNFVQQKHRRKKRSKIPNSWRIIASIWLVFCLFIVRDALLIRTHFILFNCAALYALCIQFCHSVHCEPISFASPADTRAHCLSLLNLNADSLLPYGELAVFAKHQSAVASSVPKLNRIIFFCTPIIIIIYLVSSSVVAWCQGMPCAARAHWSWNVFIYVCLCMQSSIENDKSYTNRRSTLFANEQLIWFKWISLTYQMAHAPRLEDFRLCFSFFRSSIWFASHFSNLCNKHHRITYSSSKIERNAEQIGMELKIEPRRKGMQEAPKITDNNIKYQSIFIWSNSSVILLDDRDARKMLSCSATSCRYNSWDAAHTVLRECVRGCRARAVDRATRNAT